MVLAGILKKLLFGRAFTTERGRIKLFGRMDWTLFPSRALALNLQTIGEKLGGEFVYKLGYQAGKDAAQEMVKYMGLSTIRYSTYGGGVHKTAQRRIQEKTTVGTSSKENDVPDILRDIRLPHGFRKISHGQRRKNRMDMESRTGQEIPQARISGKMNVRVVFAEEKLRQTFRKLKDSKTEDRKLYEWLNRAFDDLQNNPFCGIQIRRRLVPREYIKKYNIDNMWKYNLPNAWRLIYSVAKREVVVIAIVIEWMNHKKYERRFGYG